MIMSDTQRRGTLAGSHFIDQLIAGIGAGSLSTLILHPLDLVKTRFQVHDGRLSRDQLPTASSVKSWPLQTSRLGLFTLHYMKRIVATQGLAGCYQGLSANLTASALSWGSYFFLYSLFKEEMSKRGERSLGPFHFFFASAAAGFLTVLIANPFWLMKTRLCLQSADLQQPKRYRGLWNGLATVYQSEGLRGLYRGLVPGLVGVSHGGVQFMVYEELKKWLKAQDTATEPVTASPTLGSKTLTSLDYIMMSCASKLVASSLTYPYQVVRSRLQDARGDSQGVPYRNSWDVIKRIWKHESLFGFYKGLAPNLIRVLPGTCITFVTYEQISAYCQKQ